MDTLVINDSSLASFLAAVVLVAAALDVVWATIAGRAEAAANL